MSHKKAMLTKKGVRQPFPGGNIRNWEMVARIIEKEVKMSWWVSLEKRKKPVKVNIHKEGGTYCVGGTTVAELNITYNYSPFYHKFLDKKEGLKWLDGKKAKDSIMALSKAVILLGDTRDNDDYWAKTPGNAGFALGILLGWAKQYPNAKFRVA